MEDCHGHTFLTRGETIATKDEVRINEEIRASEVRLIGNDGEQLGIVSIQDALSRAEAGELDVVEIAPGAKPPVCRLMDYGKYKYRQAKRLKEAKKKQKVMHLKEIKMRPKIDTHDFDFKVRHAHDFIEKGDKVKINIFFRGREMVHRDKGIEILKRVMEELKDVATIEKPPAMERNIMSLILLPKMKK